MALGTLVIQCLSAEEQSVAAEILQRHGPVITSGMYVHGVGEQADVNALEAKGLLVEQLPATPELSWLDPAQQNERAAGALLAAVTDQPQRFSPLQDAAFGASPVFIVQLTGPMREDGKQALDDLDVRLSASVPDFAYKAELTDQQRSLVEDLNFVVRVIEYSATHTLRRLTAVQGLHRALSQGTVPAELVTYEVRCHDPQSIPMVAAALEQEPQTSRVVVGRRRIRFQCGPDSPVVSELATLPQVSSVDLFQWRCCVVRSGGRLDHVRVV
jgi:hypothetical protein